jgi:hypothetical protein
MTSGDEQFFAWLDGELPPAEAAEVAARVAADPELTRLAERHRALNGRVKRAFDPVAGAPVPEQLTRLLGHGPAPVIDIGVRSRRPRAWGPPQWAAMAATLAIGLLIGTLVPRGSNEPVDVQGGRIYAAAALDHALTTGLASAPSGDTRIGLTFRNEAGAVCRSFTARAASGLACRQGGRWQLRGLFAAPEGQSSDYRMAAGMDPNLAALVDSTIAGEPFDAAQEKAAKAKGWR